MSLCTFNNFNRVIIKSFKILNAIVVAGGMGALKLGYKLPLKGLKREVLEILGVFRGKREVYPIRA